MTKTHRLTARERQVLTLITSGKSCRQIAQELGISFKTAVAHRYHIYKKLDVHNVVSLMRVGMRMKLIKP